jgi:hypothetical protein
MIQGISRIISVCLCVTAEKDQKGSGYTGEG